MRKYFKLIFLIIMILPVISDKSLAKVEKINLNVLNELIIKSKKSQSSALIVYKDGQLFKKVYLTKKTKIECNSITKSVVSLAIGKLITDKKLRSIEQPVSDFYKEFSKAPKNKITIKNLLNHTSGINHSFKGSILNKNTIEFALNKKLDFEPNTNFDYNNIAVNLLSGIVKKSSGQRLDLYLKNKIFDSLEIKDFSWKIDAYGNPLVMAGLEIFPEDLAKIGQLVLNKGKYKNKRIISENWFKLTFTASQEFSEDYGLLWWLKGGNETFVIDNERINFLRKNKVNNQFVERIASIKGEYNYEEYDKKLSNLFGKNYWKDLDKINPLNISKIKVKNSICYSAIGSSGEYLIILPKKNLIIVRMMKENDYKNENNEFYDIEDLVKKL
ncbi:MAG: serine hydrolase domain-containing protein [Candidatus Sericytochromatia bacterium]